MRAAAPWRRRGALGAGGRAAAGVAARAHVDRDTPSAPDDCASRWRAGASPARRSPSCAPRGRSHGTRGRSTCSTRRTGPCPARTGSPAPSPTASAPSRADSTAPTCTTSSWPAGSRMIPKAAAAGIERIVVFSGNRAGLSDGDGIANCIDRAPAPDAAGRAARRDAVHGDAQQQGGSQRLSRRPHRRGRRRSCAGVGSPRFRLLYDIYHMQVMEGDVIATIGRYAPHHRALPHRRRPRSPRDRRHAGAQLPAHRPGDRRHRLHRIRRARVPAAGVSRWVRSGTPWRRARLSPYDHRMITA